MVKFSSSNEVVNALVVMDQNGLLASSYANLFGPLKKLSLRKSLSIYGYHSIHIETLDGCKNIEAFMTYLKGNIDENLKYSKIFGNNYKNYKNNFCKMYQQNKNFVEESFFKKYMANFSTAEDFYERYSKIENIKTACTGGSFLINENIITDITHSELNNNFERLGFYALFSYFVVILLLLIGLVVVFNFFTLKIKKDE